MCDSHLVYRIEKRDTAGNSIFIKWDPDMNMIFTSFSVDADMYVNAEDPIKDLEDHFLERGKSVQETAEEIKNNYFIVKYLITRIPEQ